MFRRMEHLQLNVGGVFVAKWVLKLSEHYLGYAQKKKKKEKKNWTSGSILSDYQMTTGFGPFKLLTSRLLQKGQDHTYSLF